MSKDEEFSIFNQVSALTSKEEFKNPQVSAEGYGSFISSNTPAVNISASADKNTPELNSPSLKDELSKEIDELLSFLEKIEAMANENIKTILKELKPCLKKVDQVFITAKKCNAKDRIDILTWAIFNLKFFIITNESAIMPESGPDSEKYYLYFLKELKHLKQLSPTSKGETLEIVHLFKLRESLIKRLNANNQSGNSN